MTNKVQGPGSDRKRNGRQEKIGHCLPQSLAEMNDVVVFGNMYIAAVESNVYLWYKVPVL